MQKKFLREFHLTINLLSILKKTDLVNRRYRAYVAFFMSPFQVQSLFSSKYSFMTLSQIQLKNTFLQFLAKKYDFSVLSHPQISTILSIIFGRNNILFIVIFSIFDCFS